VDADTSLTDAERLVQDGHATGRWVELSGEPVRAEVLAALLLGAGPAAPGRVARLRLRGARITGPLDLSHADLTTPVYLDACTFDEPVVLAEATTRSIRLRDCTLPALNADTIVVRTHLSLDGSRLGALVLYNADVTGQLDLTGATITAPGAVAVNAELLRVGGSLYARDLTVSGTVRLPNASIEGTVSLDDAHLARPGDTALLATGLTVGEDLSCRGLYAEGAILLRGARIGGSLNLTGAHLSHPGKPVLSAARIVLGHDLTAEDMVSEGEIQLHGGQIAGAIEMRRARLANPGGRALNGYRLTVGAGVFAPDGFSTEGGVHLPSARISGHVNVSGSVLRDPAGAPLSLNGAQLDGNLNAVGCTAEGLVRLWQTTVTGQVDFTGARLANPGGTAVTCGQLRARRLLLGPGTRIEGELDLRDAAVGILRDDPEAWPERIVLDGLGYEVVQPALPATRRLEWLRRNADGYVPQPYETLAEAYRRLGHDADARSVLAAKQRRRRDSLPFPARIWGYLQDATVGYGYRPMRAAVWLFALLVVGTALFAWHRPVPTEPGTGPVFNAFVYTTDLLLPLIDFGQESAFRPTPGMQWLAYGLIAAGWILATTAAAGITRALNRQ
jgi:hypothetical protein